MAWGPLHGKHQEFHSICIQERMVTPKIDAWASTTISHPLLCGLAVSRMKRDGVEVIMTSHIFLMLTHQISPSLYIEFFILGLARRLLKIFSGMQSYLLTHPRGVLPVWCLAIGRHFALCGISSFSLTF